MSEDSAVDPAVAAAFVSLYRQALPEVYGYLARRCDPAVVEDLTSETFLAATRALKQGDVVHIGIPWLIGVARHKLADHWDPWDGTIDRLQANDVLLRLGDHHRLALTLRYVDGLPVPEVAGVPGQVELCYGSPNVSAAPGSASAARASSFDARAAARPSCDVHAGEDIPAGTLRAIERSLEPCLGKGWLR